MAPPTTSKSEIDRLKANLWNEFNDDLVKLVDLYCLGEKFAINNLCNRAIDAIQDGYHSYGTVFGPGLGHKIFRQTKKDSKLRDLCVGSVILHVRGSLKPNG
jgi:hypothetical protein